MEGIQGRLFRESGKVGHIGVGVQCLVRHLVIGQKRIAIEPGSSGLKKLDRIYVRGQPRLLFKGWSNRREGRRIP
jgi:hypothetical protein